MGGVALTFDNVNLGRRGTKNVAEAVVATASKLVTVIAEAGTDRLLSGFRRSKTSRWCAARTS